MSLETTHCYANAFYQYQIIRLDGQGGDEAFLDQMLHPAKSIRGGGLRRYVGIVQSYELAQFVPLVLAKKCASIIRQDPG